MKITVYRLNSMFESNQNNLFKGTVPTDITRYKILDEIDLSNIKKDDGFVDFDELKAKLEDLKAPPIVVKAALRAAKESIAEYLFNSTNVYVEFGEGKPTTYCLNCGDVVDFDGEPWICDLAGWTQFTWGEEWKKKKEAK